MRTMNNLILYVLVFTMYTTSHHYMQSNDLFYGLYPVDNTI